MNAESMLKGAKESSKWASQRVMEVEHELEEVIRRKESAEKEVSYWADIVSLEESAKAAIQE